MRASYFVVSIYFGIQFGKSSNGCLKDVHRNDGVALLQTSHIPPANHGVVSSFSDPTLTQVETKDAEGEPCGLKAFVMNHAEGPGINKWIHYFPIYEEYFGRF